MLDKIINFISFKDSKIWRGVYRILELFKYKSYEDSNIYKALVAFRNDTYTRWQSVPNRQICGKSL